MKKHLILALILTLTVSTIIISYLYFDTQKKSNNLKKEIKVYNTLTAIPFENNKISILGKDIIINENQKYYLLSGDCKNVTDDVDSVISYDLSQNFKGVVSTMSRSFSYEKGIMESPLEADYFDIKLVASVETKDYRNKNYIYNDKSGYDKNKYDQVYFIALTCK